MTANIKKKFLSFWQHNLGIKMLMIGILMGLVIVVTILVFLMKEIEDLNSKMTYLQGNVTSINGNFNAQSQNFLNELSDTLDSESSLIASYEVVAETYKTKNNQLPLTIHIIPKVDYEDLAIEIKVIGQKTYTQTAVANKGIYTAKMPIDITEDNLNFIVKFTQSGEISNEQLDVYSDIIQSYLMKTDAESELSFMKKDSNLNISGEVVSIFNPLYNYNDSRVASLRCYPVSGQVIIKVNDQEVRTMAITLDTNLGEGEYSNCHTFTQINEVIENFKEEDHVEIVAVLVDNYGNQYTHVTNQYPE